MRGKPLTNDPAEIAAIEQKDRLYDAIALIQQFTEGFSTITPENLRQGGISALKQHAAETADVLKLTPVELFTRQYDKAKKKNPAVSRLEVAEEEEARSSILIEELEAIPGVKRYYKTDPRYKKITQRENGYLKFLNDILNHVKGEKLMLSDILVESVTPEQVKEIYRRFLYPDKPSATALQTFLKHLADKGYYSCKMTNKDIEAVARNEFDDRFKYNNTSARTPPQKDNNDNSLYNQPPYSRVPLIK